MNKSTSPRDSRFRRIVKGYIAESGLTHEQIATNLDIAPKSLQNKMNAPGMFRLMEIRRLCDILHIDEEDKIKLFVT